MMGWLEMLPEVLDIIALKYINCYEDYPSFAGVCKSWHLAAARTYLNSNGPPSRFPSLMLAEKSKDHESRELLILSNKSIRKIRLPQAYDKACKSSCGWILTMGRDFAIQLINPLSGEVINLPKPKTCCWRSVDPSNWDITILKVVLVFPSKLVLILKCCATELGFCHIGDDKWTTIEDSLNNSSFPKSDITFYNGQVYTYNKWTTIIQACNVNGKDPTVLVDVATMPKDLDDQDAGPNYYIVGLDDKERKQLLINIKHFNERKCCETYKTKSFKVLAYDLKVGNGQKLKILVGKLCLWDLVRHFGRRTLRM
ncbi:hypothetical protein Tco_0575297 [Tanacetum coccineum]